MRELAAVRKALNLTKLHLMGHSWGGAVVTSYAIGASPAGIESLVLAGPLLSTKIWIDDANILRLQLPKGVQEALSRNEEAGTVHSKEYQEATDVFYARFLYHQPDVKKPDSCAQSPPNDEIYQIMWGPTEFHATGNLFNFDVTEEMKHLIVPTMFIVGRYDEARLETVQRFQSTIAGSVVNVIENAGHMAPLEEYEAYSAVLDNFLSHAKKHASVRVRSTRDRGSQ